MYPHAHYLIQATCLEEVEEDLLRLERILEVRRYNRLLAEKNETPDLQEAIRKEWQVVYAMGELKAYQADPTEFVARIQAMKGGSKA